MLLLDAVEMEIRESLADELAQSMLDCRIEAFDVLYEGDDGA
jgi:hypothetical protein